ncbi:transmembrane protein [Ditylenchus destructor]|nr:transmembrane protein [Ditylenchus destructor]
MDTTTSNFLALVAQASMIFCLLFQRIDNVKASLPLTVPDFGQIYIDMDAHLSTVLSITLFAILIEVLLTFRQISPPAINIFSLICHTLACLTLLKFIADMHPVSHFWVCFSFFNVPPLFCQIFILLSSFNKHTFL